VLHLRDKALTPIAGTAKYALSTAGASVHIGGKHDPADQFLPEIHVARPSWNDGAFLKIRHADARRSQGEKHRIVKGRGTRPDLDAIQWKIGGRTHHFIQGSVEHTITYDSQADVPGDGVEIYAIDFPANNLQWHYQRALTQQEQTRGCRRAENVVGSYAIYGPASGNLLDSSGNPLHEYTTGKFCHVYRPQLIAANGAKVWCTQQYDPIAKQLVISLPADFVASAQYPLTLDPTFGFFDVGGSGAQIAAACCGFHPSLCYAANAGDLITRIWTYSCAGSAYAVVPYTISGGAVCQRAGVPADINAPQDEPTWITGPFSDPGLVLDNATYGLAFGNFGDTLRGAIISMDDVSPIVASRIVDGDNGSLNDPFGNQADSTYRFSIYAEYVLNPNPPGAQCRLAEAQAATTGATAGLSNG
jgi:hypothetical protein